MSATTQSTVPWSRKFITAEKEPSDTSEAYGCRPNERPMGDYVRNGVINLDKPAGPTSHEVVAWLKKMLDIDVAGHSGTLEIRGISWRDRRSARMHKGFG